MMFSKTAERSRCPGVWKELAEACGHVTGIHCQGAGPDQNIRTTFLSNCTSPDESTTIKRTTARSHHPRYWYSRADTRTVQS